MDKFRRIVLHSDWNGIIGPGGNTTEVVVMECPRCFSLVMPGLEEYHIQGAHRDRTYR